MCFEIVVTQKCNLACKYCFESEKRDNKFSIYDIPKVVKFIKEYINNNFIIDKEISISFNGGEALLNFAFIKEFIESTKDFITDYAISTNLSLLTDEMLLFFKRNKVRLHISIDGKKETNDLYRVSTDNKGYFDILMNNLLKVKNCREILTSLSMVYTPSTVNKLYENVRFLYEIGFRRIHASYASNYLWTEDVSKILLKEMERIKSFYIEAYEKCDPFYFSNFSDTIENIITKNGKACICGGFIDEIAILPDGKLLPCLVFMGNKLTLKCDYGSWKTNYNLQNINQFREKVDSLLKLCGDCDFSEKCHKTCYAELELTKTKSECVSGIGCFVNQLNIMQSESIIKLLMQKQNNFFMNEFSAYLKNIRIG